MIVDHRPPSDLLGHRAALHAALADPHRLAIVDALALSDRAPSELGRALGIPSNLLAHHLDVLEGAGIVVRRPSQGDARRRYVRLVPEALDVLVAAPVLTARAVLFVCHHNAARSLIAAALWRAASVVPADSAGLAPAAVPHPEAVATAARHGLSLAGARPKGYPDVADSPDLVVSVCDRALEAGPPPAAAHLHWSIPDPAPTGDPAVFEATFAELAWRVGRLARHVRTTPSTETEP